MTDLRAKDIMARSEATLSPELDIYAAMRSPIPSVRGIQRSISTSAHSSIRPLAMFQLKLTANLQGVCEPNHRQTLVFSVGPRLFPGCWSGMGPA